MQGFAPFIQSAVRINLPATFQFFPATSKSIDIPAYILHRVRQHFKTDKY
jgi:hypothetical protein